ncbi:PP2C family protein-serine/threonine phosphatase [Streptomyces sp. NPDC101158]|uniref:PP2C family protein-serine/threonine phosphatase n=1 Tax=Streptomyces sp. NPDC101158 TaxID=3366117 RepID=UPI0037F37ECD
MIESGRPGLRRSHGYGRLVRLSPVILTVVIAGLAYATPPELAFSRLLPAAPALAASMWPVLPTVLLGTVCLFLMIGLSLVFPDLGTWWTCAGIIAVTVAAAYGSHVRLQRERTLFHVRLVADAAQQVVLRPLPRRFQNVEIESLYLSAAAEARIGGDFYEVIDTPYGVRLLIGDVRGKGLPAVGAAAAIVNAFREAAYGEASMTDIARRLDASCARHNAAHPPEAPMERFATALLVEIPHQGSRITIVNCGHPPPLIRNLTSVRVLEPSDPSPLLSLAELIGDRYRVDAFDFSPGDVLLLYTDGIAETRARDGEFFPLTAWMRQQPSVPPRDLLTALHHDLLRHSRGNLDDDIAALAVRLHTP